MGGILQLMIASVSLGANSFVMYIEDFNFSITQNSNWIGQACLDANNDIYFATTTDVRYPSITKVNSGGTFAWRKYFEQPNQMATACCLAVANTDIFMTDTNSLFRLDVNGSVLWQKKPTGMTYTPTTSLYNYKSIAINRASGTNFNQITVLQANNWNTNFNTPMSTRVGFVTYANTGIRGTSVIDGYSDSPVFNANFVGPINGAPRSGINYNGDIVSPGTLWSRVPYYTLSYPMVPALYVNNIAANGNRAVYAWDTTSTGSAYFSGVCSDQVLNGNASAATTVMYAIGSTYVSSTGRYEMILFKLDSGGASIILQKRFYGGSSIGNTFGSDVVVDGSYVYTLSYGISAISIVKWLASDLSIQWQRHFYVHGFNRIYCSPVQFTQGERVFVDSPGLGISSTHLHFAAKGLGKGLSAANFVNSSLVVKVPKDGTKTGTYTVATAMGSTTTVTYDVSDGIDSATFFTSNTNISAAYTATSGDSSVNANDSRIFYPNNPANTTIINL